MIRRWFCPKRQWYQQISPSRWCRPQERERDDGRERWCELELLRWLWVAESIFMTSSSTSTFVSVDPSWSILAVEPWLVESSFCGDMVIRCTRGIKRGGQRANYVGTPKWRTLCVHWSLTMLKELTSLSPIVEWSDDWNSTCVLVYLFWSCRFGRWRKSTGVCEFEMKRKVGRKQWKQLC